MDTESQDSQHDRSQEQPPDGPSQPNVGARPTVGDALRETFADAKNVLGEAREVSDRPRQVRIGALLGVCVAFLIAFVAIKPLDDQLTFAAKAFAFALPFLSEDFTVASINFGANLSGPQAFFVNVIRFTSFYVWETLGYIGVGVGIVAVICDFSGALGWAVIAAFGTLATLILVGLVIVLWLLVRDRRAKRAGVEPDAEYLWLKSRFLSQFVPSKEDPPAQS